MTDPDVGSRWRLDDGREVEVVAIVELSPRQPIALRVRAFSQRGRWGGSKHRVIHMSRAGFWKRAKEQL